MESVLTASTLQWGSATLALPGENECGDACVVVTFDQGGLVAVIDALGHGHEAARTARVAAQVLTRHPREDPAVLLQRCHAALRGTRGAAISIASIDTVRSTLTWAGVGNVAGKLVSNGSTGTLRVRELLRYGGVVGDRLPDGPASVAPMGVGSTLILTTDGVDEYSLSAVPAFEPQPLADRILGRFARGTDDAAVLVARLNRKG